MTYTVFQSAGMVYVYGKYVDGAWHKCYSYYRFTVHEDTMALAA